MNLVINRLGFSLALHSAQRAKAVATMIVCHCKGVTDREIRRCVRAGAATIDDVSEACRAATGCGGCESLVGKIVQSELDAQRPRLPVLHAAALVGA